MTSSTVDLDLNKYTQLPIRLDRTSKQLSIPAEASSTSSSQSLSSLQETLKTINLLHTNLKSLDTAGSSSSSPSQSSTNQNTTNANTKSSSSTSTIVPPAPSATNVSTQKRTAHIAKLRDSAWTAYRKAQFPEAVRLYGIAIDGSLGRPSWEPVGLIREELSVLYRDRAAAHMATRAWVEGWKDCECSVECKRPQGGGPQEKEKGKGGSGSGTVVVWSRGGRCLMEMGRYADAVTWLEKATDCEAPALGKGGEDVRDIRLMLDEARKKTDAIPAA